MKSVLKLFTKSLLDVNTIKANPETREKSKVYGIASIVCSIFAIAISVLFSFGLVWIAQDDIFNKIVLGIVLGICVGGFGTLTLLIKSLTYFLSQLSINKKCITWVALCIFILSVIVAMLIILFLGIKV